MQMAKDLRVTRELLVLVRKRFSFDSLREHSSMIAAEPISRQKKDDFGSALDDTDVEIVLENSKFPNESQVPSR